MRLPCTARPTGGARPGLRFPTSRRAVLAGLAAGLGSGLAGAPRPARAAPTEIQFWHAMAGELGRQIERLVGGFNAAQDAVRVVAMLGEKKLFTRTRNPGKKWQMAVDNFRYRQSRIL